jgi:NAD-dependent deacetylase
MSDSQNSSPCNIVILTGAGISAESGLATFRGSDGLWEGHRVEDVASPEGFERDPELVQKFYNLRRAQLPTVQPNPAHEAIARLQREWARGTVTLITQNVDDLHERGGSPEVWHMHGELLQARCLKCENSMEWDEDLGPSSKCLKCARAGWLRPDIVWFGEMPMFMTESMIALERAHYFAAIGTSGKVYPAAGFVRQARRAGARCLEFNLEASDVASDFHEARLGPAGTTVPAWVDELLA